MTKVHDEPSVVTAQDGVVMVDGPGGVAMALTPDAAAETSERLLNSAFHARVLSKEREREDAARRG